MPATRHIIPVAIAKRIAARLDRIARYFVYRAAVIHLRGLDDEALRDIGLPPPRPRTAVAVHGEGAPMTSASLLAGVGRHGPASRETPSWR